MMQELTDFKNMIIISGGQTGADQGSLEGAKLAGFKTGGFIPRGYKTERGSMPELAEKFSLIATTSSDYIYRTHLNASSSSMTIWFGSSQSEGFIATTRACKSSNKMFFDVSDYSDDDIVKLLVKYKPAILNVAGNRESKSKGIQEKVKETIYNVLNKIKEIKIQ